MALRDIIKADLKMIATDMSNPTFTWKGEDYECIPSSDGAELALEMGGFSTEADIAFTTRKELFVDSLPQSQQTLIYKTKTYRILTVREDATGAFYRLICINNNRGV